MLLLTLRLKLIFTVVVCRLILSLARPFRELTILFPFSKTA